MSTRSEGCYRKEVFIMFANVTNTFNSAAVMGAPTKSSRAYKRGNSCHAYMGGVMGNSQHIKAGKCYHWNATTKWTMPVMWLRGQRPSILMRCRSMWPTP